MRRYKMPGAVYLVQSTKSIGLCNGSCGVQYNMCGQHMKYVMCAEHQFECHHVLQVPVDRPWKRCASLRTLVRQSPPLGTGRHRHSRITRTGCCQQSFGWLVGSWSSTRLQAGRQVWVVLQNLPFFILSAPCMSAHLCYAYQCNASYHVVACHHSSFASLALFCICLVLSVW